MSIIKDAIRDAVHPKPRMIWDGTTLSVVQDVTSQEIDGVIEQLNTLKERLAPETGIIKMAAAPGKIIKP